MAVAGVLLLAGCQQLQQPVKPTAAPGPAPTGRPSAAITVAGQSWSPCTARERKQFPPVLDAPAPTYYAGPWCRSSPGSSEFLWLWARPLSDQEQPGQIRGYVNTDAGLMVRNLRTTGYSTLRSSDKDEDVRYEGRRLPSQNVVGVEVLGQDPPPAGQSYSGTDPLRLRVSVRKAGPAETPAPTP